MYPPVFHYDTVTGEYLFAGRWHETYNEALATWQGYDEAKGQNEEARLDEARDEREE